MEATADMPGNEVGFAKGSLLANSWWLIPAVSACILYLATMPAGLPADGDAVKYSFLGRILGIGHPTGYPLYLGALWLFSWLPVGSMATRAVLASVVAASVAVGIVALVVARLSGSRTVGVAAAIAFSVTPTFWSQAVRAEVYALHAALLAGSLLALLRWREVGGRRPLLTAAAIVALGAAHHALIITALPAFILFCLLVDYRTALSPRTLVWYPLVSLLGLLPYSYLFIRTAQRAPYREQDIVSFADWLDFSTGSDWKGQMFSGAQSTGETFATIWNAVAGDIGVLGLLLVVAGVVALWKRPSVLVLFLGVAVGDLVFASNYDIVDRSVYFIPATLTAVAIAAIGATAIGRRFRRPSVRVLLPSALLVVEALALFVTRPRDQTRDPWDEAQYLTFLEQVAPGSYLFLSPSYLWYERTVYVVITHRPGDDLWPVSGWREAELRAALRGEAVPTQPLDGSTRIPIAHVYLAPELLPSDLRPDGEIALGPYRFLRFDLSRPVPVGTRLGPR